MTPVETRPARAPRRVGRGMVVLAVAAVCAVPATDALAAGTGRGAPAKPRPAATSRVAPVGKLDVEKESARRGWAWGTAVRGLVVQQNRKGLQTIQYQRGVVSDLTDTTVVITSVDDVSLTWTLSASTAVIVPTRATARGAGALLSGKLTENLRVRVWGVGGGDHPAARLVMADPKAPKPTSNPTSTTSTTTSETTSTTTSETTNPPSS